MPDNQPTFEAQYGVFRFSWLKPARFSITLDRIRDSHDVISAEFSLRNGASNPIYISRYNLFSSVTRKGLAADLESILKLPEFDWRKAIEFVSQQTILAYRTSQPMIKIGNLPAKPGPRWRLRPLVPEGDISVLFGPGGSGKSMLALLCAIAVQHGWDGLGLEVEKCNVAYIDWEWGEHEHNQRLKSIAAGMQLDFVPDIFYQYDYRHIEDVVEDLRPKFAEHKIKFAIFDSKVAALGGAKEAKENSEPLFRALRSLDGVSCLVIDHITKDVEGKTRSPYGDVFGTWRPRHVVEIRSVIDREGELNLGLYKYKSNLAPSLLRNQFPLGFTIQETDNGTTVNSLDIVSVPELAERMAVKSRIFDYLKNGPATVKDLMEGLSLPERAVYRELNRGKHKIFVKLDPQLRNARWGLLSTDSQ